MYSRSWIAVTAMVAFLMLGGRVLSEEVALPKLPAGAGKMDKDGAQGIHRDQVRSQVPNFA